MWHAGRRTHGDLFFPRAVQCVNDAPAPSRYLDTAQFTEDTIHVAMSRSPRFLVGCMKAYLGILEHRLRSSRVSINASKSTNVRFVKFARLIQKTHTNPAFRRANTVGRNTVESWGNSYALRLADRRTLTGWERRQLEVKECLIPS